MAKKLGQTTLLITMTNFFALPATIKKGCKFMGVVNALRTLVGLDTFEQRDEKIKQQEAWERTRQILQFPVKEMTQKEFDALPKDRAVTEEFLKTAPLGTWFLCKRVHNLPYIPVVFVAGQLVKGDDLFCDQWCGGLAVPARGINRYQIKIVA